jgi:deoxyguanosine kinase
LALRVHGLISSGTCADGGDRRNTQAKHAAIVNVSMIRFLMIRPQQFALLTPSSIARDLRSGYSQSDLLTFMAKLFDLPRYIAVEGPIRVGKSTLSNILAERLNAQSVTDPEHNSFLAPFYQGEPGAAFQAQFTFLVQRFEQLRDLDLGARSQKLVVSDFIFEKDKLFAYLNLNDQELDTYNRYYNYFRDQLPTPDLVIYLQATPEVLKKRLKKKNAAGEKAISEEYLEEVVKAYEHFFFHYTSSDLLIVNTSEIDFVERNEDLQELLRKVSAPIKGTQYFLPLGSQEAASA